MNNVERQMAVYEKLIKLKDVKQLLALNTVDTLYEVQLHEENMQDSKKII